MATVTISAAGKISISLSPQEESFLSMIEEESGGNALSDVFNLWLNTRVRDVMSSRLSRLTTAEQVDFLGKLGNAKPAPKTIPVVKP